MQTSGLVLDVYDDFRGETLRSIFTTRDNMPDLVKEAHALSSDERHRLPDDAFALVLMNDGEKLRKYACTDAGNTALSVLYFQKNAHKLPLNAQLVASTNLAQACGWYGLEELAKQAGLVGWAAQKGVEHAVAHPIDTALKFQQAQALTQGTGGEIRDRMGAIHAMEGQGNIITPHQVSQALGKHAEMSGTALMPYAGSADKSLASSAKTVVNKTGSIGHLVRKNYGSEATLGPLDSEGGTPGEQVQKLPQSKSLRPHVDVSNHAPPVVYVEKKASAYALGDRYPLDNYEQVTRAVAYFDQHGMRFSPEEKREYCTNVVKIASVLGLRTSVDMRKYAGTRYAPADEIKIALDNRRQLITDDTDGDLSRKVLDLLQEKQASIDPDLFCAALAEFDRGVKIDQHYGEHLLDPYYSTYGAEKTAADKNDNWSYLDGNLYVTGDELKMVVKTRISSLRQTFGDDFVSEFRKDPIGIFESLPKGQKRYLAAMAFDNNPGSDLNP